MSQVDRSKFTMLSMRGRDVYDFVAMKRADYDRGGMLVEVRRLQYYNGNIWVEINSKEPDLSAPAVVAQQYELYCNSLIVGSHPMDKDE